MRLLMLAGLLCAPAVLFAQTPSPLAATEPRPITLDQAVALAQQNAPQTVSARGQVRGSEAQIRRAYASFLPSLSFSTNSGYSEGVQYIQGELVPLRGDPWSFSNGFNANIQLFDGGARFRNLDRDRANARVAEANEITQLFNVSLSVKQQYYAVLAARESEAAALVQREQAMQNMRVATARVVAGAATKSDSLRSAIEVRNAEIAILSAQTQLQNANAFLTRLTGQPNLVTATAADTLDPIELNVDSTQLAAIAQRAPAVLQAQSSLSAANASRRASRAPYWPTITMSGRYSANQSSRQFQTGNVWLIGGDNPNSRGVSFAVSYPLFDQLQRETSIVQANIAQDNAEATLRDAELAAQQTLVQALGAFRLAEARIELQQASVEAGIEDLRVQQQRYELGAGTLLDVLTSQTTLNNARLALIQARQDARVAKAQIEALVGREL